MNDETARGKMRRGSFTARRLRQSAVAGLIVAGSLGFTGVAEAKKDGACGTVADTGSKVWKHTEPAVRAAMNASGPFGATAAKAATLIEKGIKVWNKLAGDKSWAKIGPRRMDYGEWNTGTLIGPTERLFISGIPAVNPVQLDFHKLDHDGKVTVVVCKVPEKGKAEELRTFVVDKKTKKGLVKSFTLNKVKGYLVTVALHGNSVGNKLKYKVRAKFIYDDNSTTRTASGGKRTGSSGKVSGKRTPKPKPKPAPKKKTGARR